MHKNKVSRKIPEKLRKIFIREMRQKETWGDPGKPPGRPYKCQARGIPGPRPGVVWGPPGPLLPPLPLTPFSLPKKYRALLKLTFLLFLLAIFDLLAQPIFSAEIWSNCSLVCNSSVYPSRILSSKVFL